MCLLSYCTDFTEGLQKYFETQQALDANSHVCMEKDRNAEFDIVKISHPEQCSS